MQLKIPNAVVARVAHVDVARGRVGDAARAVEARVRADIVHVAGRARGRARDRLIVADRVEAPDRVTADVADPDIVVLVHDEAPAVHARGQPVGVQAATQPRAGHRGNNARGRDPADARVAVVGHEDVALAV